MDFLKTIEENSILIIPNNIRDKILDLLDTFDGLKNIKILTLNDLKKGLFFDYNNEAIYYIMKNHNQSYNIAKNYIDDMYYILENDYNDEKMQELKKYKDELKNNDLLIYDSLFINMLESKNKMYVYGFDLLKKFDKYILDEASKYIEVKIIEKETNNYQNNIYNLDNIENEIFFVAEKISELISNGVDINKIYLANIDSDYKFNLKRIFKSFNIPIYLKSDTTLYKTVMGKYFIDNLQPNLDLLLLDIRNNFNIENEYNLKIYNKITNLINTYYWVDDIRNIKDLVEAETKKIIIPYDHNKYEIKETNILNNVFYQDEHVFLMNFNLNKIPRTKKDEDFINDAIKPPFLENTKEINTLNKLANLEAIKNIKNLVITYKNETPFESFLPSILIDELGYKVIKPEINFSYYSDQYNKLILTKNIDNLIKYNKENPLTDTLSANYNINYANYNNLYSYIDNTLLKKNIDGDLKFSYTNINNYYLCPFRFYLENILKLEKYQKTFDGLIGDAFHHVLETCLKENKDIIKTYDEFINTTDLELTNENKFFIEFLKEELVFVFNTIKKQLTHSNYDDILTEKELKVEKNDNLKTVLKGYIDKIILSGDDCIVVDYKTGSVNFDKREFEFGLSLQLPIYMYLLEKNGYNVAGIYLQRILNTVKHSETKDYSTQKTEALKLNGITFDDLNTIEKFDDTVNKSEIINTLSVKNGNLNKTKNILSLPEKENLLNQTDELINNAIKNISEGNFEIKPIAIDDTIRGCNYCNYRDICYRSNKDINYQYLKKDGDNNA